VAECWAKVAKPWRNAARSWSSTKGLVQGPGVLLLEVTDDGADGARPVLKDEDGGESGRGIRVVDALASRWAFRQDPDHTTVWAEFAWHA
jgi:hypothetical protein